MEYGIENMSSK